MIARLSYAIATTIVLAGFVAAASACSSDADPAATSSSSSGSTGNGGSSGNSSGGDTTLSSSECTSRCSAKLNTCDELKSQASAGCSQLCTGSVTAGQATCLEDKTCSELLEAFGEGKDLDALCPKGSTNSSSGSTSGGTSSGSTNTDTPTNLTITATIPSDYEAIHKKTGDSIASIFNVAPKPTFSPAVQITASHLPQLDKAESVTLDSPERPAGACGTAKFSFVLNSSQIGVQISGADVLPETSCATFTDALAKGATLTLKGVPWLNSSVKATVKIVLE